MKIFGILKTRAILALVAIFGVVATSLPAVAGDLIADIQKRGTLKVGMSTFNVPRFWMSAIRSPATAGNEVATTPKIATRAKMVRVCNILRIFISFSPFLGFGIYD